jgi:hypothetical protein
MAKRSRPALAKKERLEKRLAEIKAELARIKRAKAKKANAHDKKREDRANSERSKRGWVTRHRKEREQKRKDRANSERSKRGWVTRNRHIAEVRQKAEEDKRRAELARQAELAKPDPKAEEKEKIREWLQKEKKRKKKKIPEQLPSEYMVRTEDRGAVTREACIDVDALLDERTASEILVEAGRWLEQCRLDLRREFPKRPDEPGLYCRLILVAKPASIAGSTPIVGSRKVRERLAKNAVTWGAIRTTPELSVPAALVRLEKTLSDLLDSGDVHHVVNLSTIAWYRVGE